MNKIPTLFVRDPEDRAHVLPEVTPGCEWVLAGEGRPTRKYDGSCVMFDGTDWWARREVKPGREVPPNFVALSTDETTRKTVGWEPIGQSPFAAYVAEALGRDYGIADHDNWDGPPSPGTYELVGPKVNGNPEEVPHHILVRHGYTPAVDAWHLGEMVLTFEGIREYLKPRVLREGIVWHHPDGRMAKIKRKDFAS